MLETKTQTFTFTVYPPNYILYMYIKCMHIVEQADSNICSHNNTDYLARDNCGLISPKLVNLMYFNVEVNIYK